MPIPVPGPGEVRVKVAACGLNPVDAKTAQWKGMVAEPKPVIHVPGLDVVGIVDAVASDVTHFKTGQHKNPLLTRRYEDFDWHSDVHFFHFWICC